MITLQQFKNMQENENNPHLWRASLIEMAKNKVKMDKSMNLDKKSGKAKIACRGQACESNYDE